MVNITDFIIILVLILVIEVIGFIFYRKIVINKKEQVTSHKYQYINNNEITNKKNDVIISENKQITTGNNNSLQFQQINEFIIKSEQSDAELVFKKINDTKHKNKKYSEILTNGTMYGSHMIQGTTSVLGPVVAIDNIAKMAPNGIYTTSANPTMLSKFADGTYTTMVRNSNNNLVQHTGFQKLTPSSLINPCVMINCGMQVAAIVSGQYYLHNINEKLSDINNKLERLLEKHDNEKKGKLINAKDILNSISEHSIFSESDLEQLGRVQKDLGDIFNQYKIEFNDNFNKAEKYNSDKKKVKDKIDDYTKEIEKLKLPLEMCIISLSLILKSRLLEIIYTFKNNVNAPELEDKYNDFEKDYNRLLMDNLNSKQLKSKLIKHGIKIIRKGSIFTNKKELLTNINSTVKFIPESFDRKDAILGEISKQFIQLKRHIENIQTQKKEILCLEDSEGNMKFFIENEENISKD